MDNLNMKLTTTKSTNDDSAISNLIIVIIIIIILWFLFGRKQEQFEDVNPNFNTIDKDSMMMQNIQDNRMAQLYNAPNYIDRNEPVVNINSSEPTPDVRSLNAMDKISQEDAAGTSCNLLGINPEKLSNYRKKYYSMYKHQIECPKNCGLSTVGTRDCYFNNLGMKKCGLDNDKDCDGIFTSEYNNPDVFALSYLAVDNNNSKPCVTCTSNPSTNNLNRSSIAEDVSVFDNVPLKEGFSNVPKKSVENFKNTSTREDFRKIQESSYADLPYETIMADNKRLFQQTVSNANVSNYVDFENNVNLNSIGETSVDKLAEIRTCMSGTCGLKSYGKSVSNVYDKLLNTPAYTNRESCNPNSITGILEDASMSDNYANL